MKKTNFIGSNLFFLSLIFFSYFYYVKSDLPVHCLVDQIAGQWTLRINKEKFNPTLEDPKTTCGHGFPDKVDQTVGDKDYSFSEYSDLNLSLDKFYNVYENNAKVGHWTPVYDQSFVIYYKNSLLTAPYRYYKDSNGKYVSDCRKSMMGWIIPDVSNREKNWSCFFALRSGSNLFDSHSDKFLKPPSSPQIFTQMQTKTKLHNKLKYEHLSKVVDEINQANLSWKADVHEEFKGMSFLEVRKNLGLVKGKNSKAERSSFLQTDQEADKMDKELNQFLASIDEQKSAISSNETPKMQKKVTNKIKQKQKIQNSKREQDSPLVKDYKQVIRYLNTPINEIKEENLPRTWDWRNVGGINYVPHPRRQGDCGSCYVFSTVGSLEARLRIKTNNRDQTTFSRQFPLSCNFYSEGCDGGYPFFVSKFFNEFEMVPEDCLAYTQTNGSCSNVCDYQSKYAKKYVVSDYGYIGGFYGGTNEIEMMKEIRARGPIPGDLMVPFTFQYYKNGIFTHDNLIQNANNLSKTTLVDRNLSWQKVEHSIVLVGYGEENGVKYWIGMNTWGPNWGENGFFRILRGENECNIESMGDFLQIEVNDR